MISEDELKKIENEIQGITFAGPAAHDLLVRLVAEVRRLQIEAKCPHGHVVGMTGLCLICGKEQQYSD